MSVRNFVEIWIDASFLSEQEKVGALYYDRGNFSFDYDEKWLAGKHRFNIDPSLSLYKGEQPSLEKFGIFTDSAPDRWGRILMDRRELIMAKSEERPVRALTEWDYLLGVEDRTRMGALRFRKYDTFVENMTLSVPTITSLPLLQSIASDVDSELDNDYMQSKWLHTLIAPGSSLGGARPKANFLNTDESLWIAKFPKQDDREDIGLWEGVTIELAGKCGINVPQYKINRITGNHHTFMVKRFDRNGGRREMFVSAMTMLGKKDGEEASYLEIAEFIQDNGKLDTIQSDMEELWKRMVFNVMVSNRDDHLRNHGFMRDAEGWYLSPAFDINPNKSKLTHAINIDYSDPNPSIEVLFNCIDFLRLSHDRASELATQVHSNLQKWSTIAKRLGASQTAIDLMSPAFQLANEPLDIPAKKSKKKRP